MALFLCQAGSYGASQPLAGKGEHGQVGCPLVLSHRTSGATSFMAKNKGVRLVITLECTECRSNPAKRSPGVSRYTTEKNRRNTTERLELKKFCPHCNKSTVHKEIK
jgi:large subunit ribosomal protein L33